MPLRAAIAAAPINFFSSSMGMIPGVSCPFFFTEKTEQGVLEGYRVSEGSTMEYHYFSGVNRFYYCPVPDLILKCRSYVRWVSRMPYVIDVCLHFQPPKTFFDEAATKSSQ
jgi:hypothetical protein